MPHVFVSTQIRLETGPTIVGDMNADPELMGFLEARKMKQLGNNFEEYRVEYAPCEVLDRLEQKGYRVVAMTGIGQTCVWTLHKPLDN